jgi:hypothetical protein
MAPVTPRIVGDEQQRDHARMGPPKLSRVALRGRLAVIRWPSMNCEATVSPKTASRAPGATSTIIGQKRHRLVGSLMANPGETKC